ncbi:MULTISPECIES: hypothetical protein [unclassified Psychrobacillus]|uniref:hypothetical protein n=1 Tax=unclassified Psychrobacillus TaxID=2636677 RepID=UPI0030F51FDD
MEGKVYAVASAVPGGGAKYTALHLACESKKASKKGYGDVLLIDFDFDYPYLAEAFVKEDEDHGFDGLFSMIPPLEPLAREVLMSQVTETQIGIDVLRGTNQPGITGHVDSVHIEKIIECAKENYDTVILAIRTLPTCPAMVQTLIMCDRAVLVTEDNFTNAKTVSRALRRISQYYASEEPIGIVYNRYQATTKGGVSESIGKSDVPVEALGFIVYDEKTVDHLDMLDNSKWKKKSKNKQVWADVHAKMIRRYQ